MFPHRPRHAIRCPSRGPSFGLFPRHRWYSQRENGTTPYTCERFLVSGLGTPNLHQVPTRWPNTAYQPRRAPRAVGCMRLFGGLPAGMTNKCSGSNLHDRVEVDLS
jgi:hypothetical protein